MQLVKSALFIVLFLILNIAVAKEIKLQSSSEDTTLPAQVIRAVLTDLNLTFSHPYEGQNDITPSRIFSDVQNGDLDLIWFMTSSELEQRFEALYLPIYRGTLGMRLAIVKRNNRNIFANVNDLNDLKAFSVGQGKTWSDTFILEANNLKVAKTLKYPNLFLMLEGERFDYFPRGFYEPWGEVERYADLDLVVEPHVLIRYTAPMYFFTRKGNTTLANQVMGKLRKMVEDGSYQALFLADQQVKDGLEQGKLNERVVIDLANPFLSEKTPLGDKSLWYDPSTGL